MSFFTSLGNVHKWNHVVCILVLLFNFMFVRFICVTACWDTSLVFIDVHCGNIGEGDGNPLQYSCLENPMDGGAWWAAVHGVAKSQTRLSNFTFTSHFHALEKEMATHSSVLAWRIPGTGEPGGLPSMESDTTEAT